MSDLRSPLVQPDRGCLVLADISGYTRYLLGSELDHAQDVLADFTAVVVENLEPVLHIAKLEGDAVFAYVVAGDYAASTLLDTIEQTYFAFRSRRRDVDYATACSCQACALIPTLDLKVVVHDGQFVRRPIAGGEELVGGDVVLVHRLLKNSAADALATSGYALFTDACIAALGLDPAGLGMLEHRESYEDVGDVVCWLEDLDARWRLEQERRRDYVSATHAQWEVVRELPVAPAVAWDYLTSPQRRTLWQADRVDQDAPGGRNGVGTVNHCVHGRDTLVEEVLDWRPFRYFTVRYAFPETGGVRWTYELEPTAEATTVRARAERLSGARGEAWSAMAPALEAHVESLFARLEALLASLVPSAA